MKIKANVPRKEAGKPQPDLRRQLGSLQLTQAQGIDQVLLSVIYRALCSVCVDPHIAKLQKAIDTALRAELVAQRKLAAEFNKIAEGDA